MPQSKSLTYGLKIIKEHPQVFEALAEYDRTFKLPKTMYREKLNITIDAQILKKFKQYAREKRLNISRVIEDYMKRELGLK